jgi:hypothetical protein
MLRPSASLQAVIVALAVSACDIPAANAQPAQIPNDEMPSILQDYVYGFAPVSMAATRALSTAVPDAAISPGRAPLNQFARLDALATPASRLIPHPNADTLYSLAWLELAREPMILHVPNTAGRYYLIPLYDAYSNEFASVGSRTTGDGEGDFAVVGPLWRGGLPPDLAGVIRAPTNTVWLIGRTLVRGAADLAAARAVTDQYQLVPLPAFAQFRATGSYTPPTNVPVTPPNPDFVGVPITNAVGFSMPEFFGLLLDTSLTNPPPVAQLRQVSQFVRDGFVHQAELTPAVAAQAEAVFLEELLATTRQQNGWSIDLTAGNYGTDYLKRAAIARFGPGANIAADAVYPGTTIDAAGNPLVGTTSYTIHFAPGQTPPVRGFWSLTVYDQSGFLVANPIDRYSPGSETGLTANPDGSIDILLQNSAPSSGQSNWLPTPADGFNLTLRCYWPEQPILDGTYVIPPVEPVPTAP